MSSNMKLMILTLTDQLEDALLLFRTEMLPRKKIEYPSHAFLSARKTPNNRY